jgi:CubicO group peptidase (beta-lactamase class C family)
VDDLNKETDAIRYEVAKKSITILSQGSMKASRTDYAQVPLSGRQKKIAYVGIGLTELNEFGRRLKKDFDAETFTFSYKDGQDKADEILKKVHKDGKYDAIIIGVHDYSLRPANNFGISKAAVSLYRDLNFIKTITMTFGNVLATKNFCDAYTLVACYQDDEVTHQAAADLLQDRFRAQGKLPVSVCQYQFGDGIVSETPEVKMTEVGLETLSEVDSIVNDAISRKAFPGAVVMAVHKGEILYHKAFGNYEFGPSPAVTPESIFDLASVTKISATTLAIMKLYEEGKVELDKRLGDYLPWVKGTNKAHLRVDDILLHQAGLVAFIPFYKETIDLSTGVPHPDLYADAPKPGYSIRVAEKVYLRDDWKDTLYNRILFSPLGPQKKYVYSDNDFIFLGEIVKAVSGLSLDEYVQKHFYSRLGMLTTGFKPRTRFPLERIVPTETERHFRRQTIQGDVHDEGASMFGGVAGHAGLFSTAYDLALLYQMLLNGGEFNGKRYLKESTIRKFTEYRTSTSRRGFGFDKPEKDNRKRREPYPSELASPQTFGHTGFTGTCVWVDPKYDLVYIFLSNRVNPTRDNPWLSRLQVRGKIQDVFYRAIQNGAVNANTASQQHPLKPLSSSN